MLKKKTYFTVGLFVLVGILGATALIIWLGASQYFQKGKTYVTYFDESVQGLQIDSSVKYRGVSIGIVDQINVAPDHRLIEVVMKIDYDGEPQKTIAKLKNAGITGIVYVELDHAKDGDAARSPKISFTPEYPVIPSNRSDIEQIFSGINSVMEQVQQIDFKGISDELKTAVKNVNTLITGNDIKKMLKHLEAATSNLENMADSLNKYASDGRVDNIINNTREAVRDAKTVIGKVNKEIEGMNLAETSDKANRLVDQLSGRTRVITSELIVTSENLRRATENLEQLMERLRADPSELIFSKPPEKKR